MGELFARILLALTVQATKVGVGLNCISPAPNSCIGILIPTASEQDFIWRQSLERSGDV